MTAIAPHTGMKREIKVEIVLGNMDNAAMRPIRQGDPDRVNYHTPSPVAKGVRDCFA